MVLVEIGCIETSEVWSEQLDAVPQIFMVRLSLLRDSVFSKIKKRMATGHALSFIQ